MAAHTSIITWGSGEDGQLGIGNNEEKEWVCVVDALEPYKIRSVVAGSRNSLAICDDGKLFTWGWNQRGTLGHPPLTKTENIPSQVNALANVNIVQAAIGGWHCLAVDDQGRAYAWGGNEYGQCGEEPERKDDTGRPLRRDIVIPQRCASKLVRQVAAGGNSVVLTREGHISVPVRVQGLERVKLIAVGAFHNLALQEDGTLWAWGNNEYGQLGTGDTQPRSQPIPVQGLSGLTLVDIAAGGWHSTAQTDDGEVYGWGRGEHGRLGFGDNDKSSKMVPQRVHLLAGEHIVQVSCGGTHSVALTLDGRMFSFGRGDHGRLGYGRKVTTGQPLEVPIDIPPPRNLGTVKHVGMGYLPRIVTSLVNIEPEPVEQETMTHDSRRTLINFYEVSISFILSRSAPETQDTAKGFTKSLAMTILSEVGDRTFCVAAILAMRYPRKSVLLGCLVSVIAMTIVSALLGWAAPNLISKKWTHHITTLLFFGFGLRSLWEGFTRMMTNCNHAWFSIYSDNEELEEVEKELEKDLKASAGKSKTISKKDENLKKQHKPFLTHFVSTVFLKAFSLTFFGEWGDKSQLATIGLAADEDTIGVILGGILGQALCTVAAVLGGKSLASRISERLVSILGGFLFLVFGVQSLVSPSE
ncbi:hypothetical protein GH714_032293 [Hevea brasiliensis]|uniref:RCC1-like domain-containing protein n=1 Tax=Hevea brasiliensis TaxID=3981 RepID=A0A6A6LHD3_HEVBR|nr:hypothetical protein GH714_032293 [Hevea brasiliensis]